MKTEKLMTFPSTEVECVEHLNDLLYNYPAMLLLLRQKGYFFADEGFYRFAFKEGLIDLQGFVRPQWCTKQKLRAFILGSVQTLNAEEHSRMIPLGFVLFSWRNITELLDRIRAREKFDNDQKECHHPRAKQKT